MNHLKLLATLFGTLALPSLAEAADCTRLQFNSLPSAQGWIYFPQDPASSFGSFETNIMSVDGTVLRVNTLHDQPPSGSPPYGRYTLPGIVPSNALFTLTFRARIAPSAGVPPFDIVCRVKVDHPELGRYYFFLGTNFVGTTLGGGRHLVDATQFRTYRMEAVLGEAGRLYVDDVLVAQGGPAEGEENVVTFETDVMKSLIEITQLDFCVRRGPTVSANVASMDVCWDSLTNRQYQVQYRSALTTNQWANLGNPVAGSGSTNCITDTVRGEPQRFYRVVETHGD